jgi:hypothetical protein
MRAAPLIYMDLCAWKRPLDRQDDGRIRLEADSVLAIISAAENGQVRLLGSSVLLAENEHNPMQPRKEKAAEMLRRASAQARLSDHARTGASALVRAGFKPADALHVAVALEARADAFVSTDDSLLKRISRSALPIRALNPILLAEEITHEER